MERRVTENMENNEQKSSPNKEIINNILKSPKSVMSNQTRPTSSYGIKLSANMTSQAKQDLLNKLEEWRKAKRQNLAKTMPDKLKPSTPVNKAPMNSTINKSCIQNSENMLPPKGNLSKDSVFERLYRNEKPQKKLEKSVADSSCVQINRNDTSSIKHVDVFSSDEEYCFERKTANEALSTETTGLMTDPPNHFEETEKEANLEVSSIITKNDPSRVEKETTQPDTSEVKNNLFQLKNLDASEKKEFEIDCIAPEMVKGSHLNQSKPKCLNESEPESFDKPMYTLREEENERSFATEQEATEKTNQKESNPTESNDKDKQPLHGPRASVDEPKKSVSQNKTSENPRPTIRRSISMLYRQKKGLLRTASEKNLNELKSLPHRKDANPKVMPKLLAKKNKLIMKPTTAISVKGKKVSTTTSLRTNLENWLKVNKHSLDGYRHLRCFGITKDSVNASGSVLNKPWQVTDTHSSEPTREDEDKENALPMSPPQKKQFEPDIEDCKNWLNELYRLIVDVKYPLERCEEWLTAIRNKCPTCTQLPIYWECLTALNGDGKSGEGKENGTCEENKAEPNGEALAEIFDKMMIENQKPSKLEKGLDPDNIFKSTVIKFAVTQTPSKSSIKETGAKSNPESVHMGQFVATPVRRSTRIKTPSKGIVDSLRGLTPDPTNKVTFKANASLLDRL